MDKPTIQDYLRQAGMETSQSEALSNILGEMVTRAHLRAEIGSLKADLTWRLTALIVFLAAVMTLIDVFVD